MSKDSASKDEMQTMLALISHPAAQLVVNLWGEMQGPGALFFVLGRFVCLF